MPKSQTKTVESDANSALAFNFWQARCFQDGSPEEDLFRAVCANSMKGGVKLKSRPRNSKRTASQPKALIASGILN